MTAPAAFDNLADLYAGAVMSDIENTRFIRTNVPGGLGRGLDIGCGTGRYAELLADRCDSVLAVDVSQRMLDIAQERHARPSISYQLRGLFDVTRERDGTFEVVLATFVLHMLPSHELALKHLTHVLAPHGHLILIDKVAPQGRFRRLRRYYVALRHSLYLVLRRRTFRAGFRELWTHTRPEWIAHQRAYPGLPRDELHAIYGKLLAGATVVDHVHACAVHWQAR